ncbi:MAG: NAD(P)H-dependent oxidoreductase [Paracoccaceae bacterium]|nr:NAD(P)H-dependent oxidoreductase [Paracoccaceae bacterium]MDG1739706.1 NAD(P)H-dependent oxidoreductase [Paracoccaceae bacterium]MDG2258726.1 NAD(P)H-dependent oxidoreductase [Paracoccaceae bacterium]
MTHTLLRVDTSARRTGSISRQLTDAIVAKLAPAETLTRDLANALPQIDETWVGANFTPADKRSEVQVETLALSDTLIAELRAADAIIIGVPVYNFGVPTALKAWIDLIARAGETFKYTETGPVGLLENKKVYIAMASGGVPVGSPMDYATTYLKQVLNFVGLTDIEIIAADGMATDAENKLKAANDAVANIAA